MYSLRKWLYKPKKTDTSLLAQFYHSDEELYLVASELDTFDGRRDPERCAMLVNELRFWQDSVLSTIEKVMDDAISNQRTSRDFRVKFPDDVLHESLAGQLWFGAECLAAGSIIMNREVESASMRPLARALTKNLDSLRALLRDQCLRNIRTYSDKVKEALVIFDKLLAEFELSYVSSMVPVKTMREYDLMQDVIVLFSETLHRGLKLSLLSQDQVDVYEPTVMFTIPRLAIVCGLLVYPEGPLNPDNNAHNMSEMFRPFQTVLYKIRELLYTLSAEELYQLEKLLCSQDHTSQFNDDYLSFADYTKQYHSAKPALYVNSPEQTTNHEQPLNDIYDTSKDHIIVHSPDSGGSPVTPVNEPENATSFNDFSLSISKSVSVATIVAKQQSEDLSDSDSSSDDIEPTEMYLLSDIAAISHVIDFEVTPVSEGVVEAEAEYRKSLEHELHNEVAGISNINAVCRHRNTCSCGPSRGTDISDTVERTNIDRNTNNVAENIAAEPETVTELSSMKRASRGDNMVLRLKEENIEDHKCTSLIADTEVDHQCCIPKSNRSKGDELHTSGCVCSKDNNDCGIEISCRCVESCFNDTAISKCQKDAKGCSCTKFGCCNHRQETIRSTTTDAIRGFCNNNDCICQPIKPRSHSEASQHFSEQETKTVDNNATKDLAVEISHCSNDTCHHRKKVKKQRCVKQKSDSSQKLSNPIIPSKSSSKVVDEKTACCGGKKTDASRCSGNVDCNNSLLYKKNRDEDTQSIGSSDTSSYNSESHDDEEIALAIRAAELASRNEVRSRFQSSNDLLHRLFVCVSGVADQLQTNYASDLRSILKCVFDMNCTEPQTTQSEEQPHLPTRPTRDLESAGSSASRASLSTPPWLPDVASSCCMGCSVPFTLTRRRHHCRNCGKIFCWRCSSNSVPLPHFGHQKPVRVCIRCFIYHVTPFSVSTS